MSLDRSAQVAQIVSRVRKSVGNPGSPVLLHQPTFEGNESAYVQRCLDSGWVSSAGQFVGEFERQLAHLTGAAYAVAVVNGTAALHLALLLAGVRRETEVLMPALTFVATANAASYCGAVPHFCDVDYETLGLNVDKLAEYLSGIAEVRSDVCFNRRTGRQIAAIIPVHTFGHCAEMESLQELSDKWRVPVVEDAAESLGSYYRGKHTGSFGLLGVLSFNGNKTVTTGAGGAILTSDAVLARNARHISTTAKIPHEWEYVHDEVGYNYRMPNLNAALGCAQLECLPGFLARKRELAQRYIQAFADVAYVRVFTPSSNSKSNYWLNTIILEERDVSFRDCVLAALNEAGLQSRPVWRPMHCLPMYCECPRMDLGVTEDLALRTINVPSSAGLVAGPRD